MSDGRTGGQTLAVVRHQMPGSLSLSLSSRHNLRRTCVYSRLGPSRHALVLCDTAQIRAGSNTKNRNIDYTIENCNVVYYTVYICPATNGILNDTTVFYVHINFYFRLFFIVAILQFKRLFAYYGAPVLRIRYGQRFRYDMNRF